MLSCYSILVSAYISPKSAINLFFQNNDTSNRGQNQTMAMFQASYFLLLCAVAKYIHSHGKLMAVNLLIQKENNGCRVNSNTYGKVLCEYNFGFDLQGEILMEMLF